MIFKVSPNVWKIANDSNIYYIKGKNMLIDCGDRLHIEDIKKDVSALFDPLSIKIVVITHLHYDHCGCIDLFPNAKFYAHPDEIKNYKENPLGLVFDDSMVELLSHIKLLPLIEIEDVKIIHTPGHTAGGICLLYDGILFTGDTLFDGGTGRTDLYSSDEAAMQKSLEMLEELEYEVLCPGHDY